MLRDELRRLCSFEERHRRLLARLLLAFALSLLVFVVTAVAGSFASFFRSGDA